MRSMSSLPAPRAIRWVSTQREAFQKAGRANAAGNTPPDSAGLLPQSRSPPPPGPRPGSTTLTLLVPVTFWSDLLVPLVVTSTWRVPADQNCTTLFGDTQAALGYATALSQQYAGVLRLPQEAVKATGMTCNATAISFGTPGGRRLRTAPTVPDAQDTDNSRSTGEHPRLLLSGADAVSRPPDVSSTNTCDMALKVETDQHRSGGEAALHASSCQMLAVPELAWPAASRRTLLTSSAAAPTALNISIEVTVRYAPANTTATMTALPPADPTAAVLLNSSRLEEERQGRLPQLAALQATLVQQLSQSEPGSLLAAAAAHALPPGRVNDVAGQLLVLPSAGTVRSVYTARPAAGVSGTGGNTSTPGVVVSNSSSVAHGGAGPFGTGVPCTPGGQCGGECGGTGHPGQLTHMHAALCHVASSNMPLAHQPMGQHIRTGLAHHDHVPTLLKPAESCGLACCVAGTAPSPPPPSPPPPPDNLPSLSVGSSDTGGEQAALLLLLHATWPSVCVHMYAFTHTFTPQPAVG
jgi:hypothetical protein